MRAMPQLRRQVALALAVVMFVLTGPLDAAHAALVTTGAGPYQVELTEGKPYFYCRCGRSQKQPFCDGTHAGTGIEPLRFVVDHTGTFNICGCKQTDDEPFCDGSHLLL